MDMLPVIENVVKTMSAKDVRTVITICNDRLDELGEEKFVIANATKAVANATSGRGGSRRKPLVLKRLPTGECFDGLLTFKDLKTDWVNLKDMQDGEFAVASIGFDKKVYAIVTKVSGDKTELNGVDLHDMSVIRSNTKLADL